MVIKGNEMVTVTKEQVIGDRYISLFIKETLHFDASINSATIGLGTD